MKDRFDTAPEPDEPLQSDLEQDQDELYDEDQFYRESEAIPPGPAPKLQANPSNRPSETPNLHAPSSIKPPSRTITDLFEENEYSFEGKRYLINFLLLFYFHNFLNFTPKKQMFAVIN